MSARSIQNYKNHRSLDFVYMSQAVVLLLVLLLAVVSFFAGSLAVPLLQTGLLLLTLANLVIFYKVRHYPLTLQDRIIRLEMQVRLRRVLPAERHWEINGLTIPQLVGLRFASDEELPALVRRVLDEHIEKADTIKQLVKNWEPDHQRV